MLGIYAFSGILLVTLTVLFNVCKCFYYCHVFNVFFKKTFIIIVERLYVHALNTFERRLESLLFLAAINIHPAPFCNPVDFYKYHDLLTYLFT